MRKDMQDLIVNTGRHAGYGKRASSRRARFKSTDDEQMPYRISTARHRQFGYDGKELGDRTRPLWRFLEANCGRPWDDVYSDIKQAADHRSIRGYHLLTHVWMYVVPNTYDVGHRGHHGPFFVDTDGTLQKERTYSKAEQQARWRAEAGKKYKDWPKEEIVNPRLVESTDHWWERIEGFWFEFTQTHWTTPASREDLAMIDGEVQIIRIRLRDETHHDTKKRQVGSKEQKKLDAMYVQKKAA